MWKLSLTGGRELAFGPLPGVMAILNVTPDSFSDGGRLSTAAAAIAAGLRAAEQGAVALDVGGESTRPKGAAYGAGASAVSLEDELRRVIPVIEGLRTALADVAISVDTRKTEVARHALDAGADIVNLVTGLDAEPSLLALLAARGAGLVLNHCRGTPDTTFAASRFRDVVPEVTDDLLAAHSRATAAGVGLIFLDPGLGFGKDVDQNFALLRSLSALTPHDAPLVVGASRKAFLGADSGRPPGDRLPESLAAVAVAARFASRPVLVRVHDVDETARFLKVLGRVA